ncbi:hypothetical protein SAMN05428954_1682 [Streptomyces sp. 2112.3]|nr:hypothetical protein SAMN05428954_1682 [Streptomyces sp. 2112.3]
MSGTSLGLCASTELLPVGLRLREDRVDGGAAARTGAGQEMRVLREREAWVRVPSHLARETTDSPASNCSEA